MTESKCATCGKTVSLDSEDLQSCELCAWVDLDVLWCNDQCQTKGLEAHQGGKCAGPSKRSININDENSFQHFCTPACRVEIVTPRFRLRPVELSDSPRIFKIKNDPLVSDMQLYGNITNEHTCHQFVQGYVGDNIPSLSTIVSPSPSRTRYVFAIEPRTSRDGTRSIQPKPFDGARHVLGAEGYIGNIAVEMMQKGGGFLSRQTDKLEPKRGKVFHYPEREELAKTVEACLFYELHPNFWRQGIMNESLKAIISFCFSTLNVSSILIDPQDFNLASIALAEQHGFKLVGEKSSWFSRAKQLLYRLEFDDWQKGRSKKQKKRKAKGKGKAVDVNSVAEGIESSEVPEAEEAEVEERRKCCRWCQVPSSNAILDCSGCHWAFWCSQACKTADLTYDNGHSLYCPARNGKPSTNSSKRKQYNLRSHGT